MENENIIKNYTFYITGLGNIKVKAQSEFIAKQKLLDDLFDSELITILKIDDKRI